MGFENVYTFVKKIYNNLVNARKDELALLGELLGFKKIANNRSSDLLQEHVCPLPWSAD